MLKKLLLLIILSTACITLFPNRVQAQFETPTWVQSDPEFDQFFNNSPCPAGTEPDPSDESGLTCRPVQASATEEEAALINQQVQPTPIPVVAVPAGGSCTSANYCANGWPCYQGKCQDLSAIMEPGGTCEIIKTTYAQGTNYDPCQWIVVNNSYTFEYGCHEGTCQKKSLYGTCAQAGGPNHSVIGGYRIDGSGSRMCEQNSECDRDVCIQPYSDAALESEAECNGNETCLKAFAFARSQGLVQGTGHKWWVQDNGDNSFVVVCANTYGYQPFRGPTPTTQVSLPSVTPSSGPACNSPCNQPADCQGAQDGCTVCDTSTNTCKPPTNTSSCNAVCTRDSDCVGSTGSQNTCPVCINGTCQAEPTPTTGPACNSACVRDSDCAGATGAQGACPSCIGGTCKATPACNSACVRDSDCIGATGAQGTCPVCQNGTCQANPTPTTAPACGVACDDRNPTACAGARDGCTACVNDVCAVPPTATPTPIPFSEDMCKCDGIEYSELAGGQPAAITSFAKVLTADQDIARVVSQTFTLYEGTETTGRILLKSDPIAATFVNQDAEKARFKSVWNFQMPNLKDGATYRIQSKILCADKRTASNRLLIAQATDNRTIFDAIINFFAQLLGVSNNAATTQAPTPTPFRGIVSTQGDDASPAPTSSNLQLGTFTPVQVFQKTCTFIKFKAGFN